MSTPTHSRLAKVTKRFPLTLLGLLFLGLTVYAYRNVTNLPKAIRSYEGLTLGMPMSEVKYVMGYPDSVLFPPEDLSEGKGKPIMTSKVAADSDIASQSNGVDDFLQWTYLTGTKELSLRFNEKTKKLISIGCKNHLTPLSRSDVCQVNNVQLLDSEDKIISELGTPTNQSINGVTKSIYYKDLNMTIYLTKRIAYYISVDEYQGNF